MNEPTSCNVNNTDFTLYTSKQEAPLNLRKDVTPIPHFLFFSSWYYF